MVIAIEPGIYFEGRWGIRLEHTVLVTPTGAQVLSAFRHAFEQP
jgi:Xaa-Pro aminopeptidase